LIAAALASSIVFYVGCGIVECDVSVSSYGGGLRICEWRPESEGGIRPDGMRSALRAGLVPHNLRTSSAIVPQWGQYGDYQGIVRGRYVCIPYWIPLAATALPTALLFACGRRRRGYPFCERCGYNLTGNTSGRCPECGTPLEADVPGQPPSDEREEPTV
jgi:hypothetical protein